MSYEIIYDKQFIKVKDKFVPLVLWGSNNCYEYTYNGRERRERGWYNVLNYLEKQLWTKEELLQYCENRRKEVVERIKERDGTGEPDVEQNFGYYTSINITGHIGNTSYKQFKGIFTGGMKRALTVEQLYEHNIRIRVVTSPYDTDKKLELCKEKGIEYLEPHVPKTTDELIEMVKKFEDNYKDTNIAWYINFVDGQYVEDKIKRVRKEIFPRKRRNSKTVETNEYYTIIAKNGQYFHRFIKYGYRYSLVTPKYYFLTENDAKQFIKSKNGRGNLSYRKETSRYPVNVTVRE